MIVLRMKAFDMTHRSRHTAGIKPVLAPAHRVFVSHRPTIGPRHHAHAVTAQHMQLLRHACAIRHRLDVAVARQQQLPVQRLQHLGAPLRRIGPRHQLQQRVHIVALRIILHHQRQRRRRFGNQLHTAKADRIAAEPRARQRHGITRAPRHPPRCLIGHHRPCRTGLLLRGILPATASKEIQDHRFAPHLSLVDATGANHPAALLRRRDHRRPFKPRLDV